MNHQKKLLIICSIALFSPHKTSPMLQDNAANKFIRACANFGNRMLKLGTSILTPENGLTAKTAFSSCIAWRGIYLKKQLETSCILDPKIGDDFKHSCIRSANDLWYSRHSTGITKQGLAETFDCISTYFDGQEREKFLTRMCQSKCTLRYSSLLNIALADAALTTALILHNIPKENNLRAKCLVLNSVNTGLLLCAYLSH